MQNIIILGLVSFFIDIGTEMIYPLIPLYLTGVLGVSTVFLGVIEGIAESLASLMRIYSGHMSDKYKKSKPFAFIGYGSSIVYKIILLVSTSWVGVMFARIIDRFGKGMRTSPRDSLIAKSSSKEKLGKSFGIHKMLDMLGSSIGIFVAYLVMLNSNGNDSYRKIFIISIVPAIIGVFLIKFIKEHKQKEEIKEEKLIKFKFSKLDKRLKGFLIVTFLFTLGNSSNTFLLLKAGNIGFDSVSVILLYFIYTFSGALLALPVGGLSDKIGRRKLLVLGYAIFGVVYFGFALTTNKAMVVGLFILYGIYTALTVGVERALISEISHKSLKGTVLGLHSALVGIALLPASIIAGLLWEYLGPASPFFFGGTLSCIAAIALFFILRKPIYHHD